MMNQPHSYVNKLRESCHAMGKCREATRKAERIKSYGPEPVAVKADVSTSAKPGLDANPKG